MSCGTGPHWHFRLDGSIQRTETPETTPLTEWVKRLLREVSKNRLSPSETVVLIRCAPEFVRNAFNPHMLDSWTVFQAHWQWPLCWASSSIGEVVRSQNGAYAHLRDERGWEAACSTDRTARGLLPAATSTETHKQNLADFIERFS